MGIDGSGIQFPVVFEMVDVQSNILPGNIFRKFSAKIFFDKVEELIQE